MTFMAGRNAPQLKLNSGIHSACSCYYMVLYICVCVSLCVCVLCVYGCILCVCVCTISMYFIINILHAVSEICNVFHRFTF